MTKLFALRAFGAVLLASTASAQLRFDVEAEVTADPTGSYTVGQTIQISFWTTAAGSTSGSGDSTMFYWGDFGGSDDVLFDNVTFTGASGVWTRPDAGTQSVIDVYADYADSGGPGADFTMGVDRRLASTGLTVGSYELTYLTLEGRWNQGFAGGDTLPNINEYFTVNVGSPAIFVNGGGIITLDNPLVGNENDGEIVLSFTSMTISVIPEPSTYAAWTAFASFALVVLIRRRRAQRCGTGSAEPLAG